MSHKHVRLAREQLKPEVTDRALRPAMRCVETTKIAPGRQVLPPGWWNSDFEPGSAVRWREQVAIKRAYLRGTGRLKHDVDERMQKEARRLWGCHWQFIASGQIDGQLRWMQVKQ